MSSIIDGFEGLLTPTKTRQLTSWKLATHYGVHAVKLIAKKKFGEMVSYQPPIITSVPLEKAISNLKLVESDCELVKIAEGMGVNFGR